MNRTKTLVVVALFVVTAVLTIAAVTAHDARDSDEHGTTHLAFAPHAEGCSVTFSARHVGADQALLEILTPMGRSGPVSIHEQELNGTAESEGDGFRFQADPVVLEMNLTYTFRLSWDGHAVRHFWSGNACDPDPRLRVHQDEAGGAVVQIEGCTFFVEGQHLRGETGDVVLKGLHEDEERRFAVLADDTEPEEDGPGHSFLIEVNVPLSGTYSVRFEPTSGDRSQGFTFFDVAGCSTEPPACPAIVSLSHDEGANNIRWEAVEDALSYRIYRAEGDGALALLAEETHPVSSHRDAAVEPGVTYRYQVTAIGEVGESSDCPVNRITTEGEGPDVCPPVELHAVARNDGTVFITAVGLDRPATLTRAVEEQETLGTLDAENTTFHDTTTTPGVPYTYRLLIDGEACALVDVTAIPVFPSIAAALLALVGGLAGYVVVRRR